MLQRKYSGRILYTLLLLNTTQTWGGNGDAAVYFVEYFEKTLARLA